MIGNLHIRKITKRTNAIPRPPDLPGIHRIALSEPELSANHPILCARITRNIDPFDKSARAFAHDIHEINGGGFRITCNPGLYFNEGFTTPLQRIGKGCAAAFYRVTIIPFAVSDFDFWSQASDGHAWNFA